MEAMQILTLEESSVAEMVEDLRDLRNGLREAVAKATGIRPDWNSANPGRSMPEGTEGKSWEDLGWDGETDGEGVPCMEIRLQVQAGGWWQIHGGSPCYDTDHRGFWESTWLSADTADCDLVDLVNLLVEGCAEAKLATE